MLSPLPIDPLIPDVLEALRERSAVVVVAPPGSGKTTRIPPALVRGLKGNAPDDSSRQNLSLSRVVLLQPRRVAARAAASRIAEEQGWRLGEEVGYQIRFENRTTPQTWLRVATEGILTRQIESDPFLEGNDCVVLDEFHERSIHSDLAIALLREIQSTVRPDLKLVVMSATLNPGPVAEFLGGCPVLEGSGRMHPVSIEYRSTTDSQPVPIWEKTSNAIREVLKSPSAMGHCLVFLPGMGEIRKTADRIEDEVARCGFALHILHSAVSNEDQDRAFRRGERPKVILATNIAETSLTIDGVRTVIDSGWVRLPVQDVRLGIDRLELRRISRASAEQRAGRAGRTAPGCCLRLWSTAEQSVLVESESPEVHRVDLAATLLAIRRYGVQSMAAFSWFEPPRPDAMERADRLLWMLGAIDGDGKLTEHGKRLAKLPVHPRIGCLLLSGMEEGLLEEAATMAALLTERDIFLNRGERRRQAARWHGESDLVELLESVEGSSGGTGRMGSVDPTALRTVERVRDELIRVMRNLDRE